MLADFSPPPDQVPFLPSLPSPPRSWKRDDWVLSTHIIPAAYLRSSADIQLPSYPEDSTLTKDQRRNLVNLAETQLRELRRLEDLKPLAGHPKILWICLNRYVKTKIDSPGFTLFLAHANGFNKETWEPTLEYLLPNPHITEIWVYEAVQHGDSSLLNNTQLSSMCVHWSDSCRDILDFLVYYLPVSPGGVLPLHLPRLPDQESHRRLDQGFGSRKLIAVGHSFGGCACTLAALEYPKLFSGLILADPVINRPPSFTQPHREFGIIRNDHGRHGPMRNSLALGALNRRGTWNSRSDIWEQFTKSPFFSVWHPAVLRLYIEHGIFLDSDSKYRLKTPPLQEAIVFTDTFTGAEDAWTRLPMLDETIEIRWIVPGEGKPEIGGVGATRERVWLRPKNCSNIRINNVGHLLVQEAPKSVADEIRAFVERKYRQLYSNTYRL